MKFRTPFILLALGFPCVVSAAPATVIKAGELKSKPFLDAPVSGTVAADSEVDTQASDGAWVQVKTKDGKSGWLRMLNLRPKTAGGSATAGLSNLGNVARTGSTGTTATTGAKGISKDQLAQASPNEAEVNRLDALRVSAEEAKRFAKAQKLTARSIEIPPPAK